MSEEGDCRIKGWREGRREEGKDRGREWERKGRMEGLRNAGRVKCFY